MQLYLLNCWPSLSLSLPSIRRNLPPTKPRLLPRAEMASLPQDGHPPLAENRIVLGCGALSVDFLATVEAFPKPDDKIRSTSLKVEGGGNAGNALTSAARLGLKPRLISKIASDAQGRNILTELEGDGVDTSFIVVSEGNSPFTYIIVDNETKTRTCIHTPGYPPMVPNDLSNSKLSSALDGSHLVYFDGRLHETALVVAEECRQPKEKYLYWLMLKERGKDWMTSSTWRLILCAQRNFRRHGRLCLLFQTHWYLCF